MTKQKNKTKQKETLPGRTCAHGRFETCSLDNAAWSVTAAFSNTKGLHKGSADSSHVPFFFCFLAIVAALRRSKRPLERLGVMNTSPLATHCTTPCRNERACSLIGNADTTMPRSERGVRKGFIVSGYEWIPFRRKQDRQTRPRAAREQKEKTGVYSRFMTLRLSTS